MNLEVQIKMYEEENHRMHALVDEFKGKCYRHGVLYKSGMGFDSCPACYWESEANNLRVKAEKAAEQKIHPTLGESAASDSLSKLAPKRVI